MCRCGRRATSELSYAEEMDQRQDASSPSLPLSPPTDGSYQTPVTESVTRLVPVPEDVQLPSPTTSEEEPIPVPPPRATTPGREVSGQHCWTRCKFDKAPGTGASGRLFWRSSGLQGKDRARPYPAGRGEALSGTWYFVELFLCCFAQLSVLFYSPTFFLSVSLFKEKTIHVLLIPRRSRAQRTTTMGDPFPALSKRSSLWVVLQVHLPLVVPRDLPQQDVSLFTR